MDITTTTTTTRDLNEEEKEFLIFETVERVLRAIPDLRQLSAAAAAADQQTASSSSSSSSKEEEEEHGNVPLIQLAQNLIPGEQILEALVRMRSSLPHNQSPNGPELEITEGFLKKVEITKEEGDDADEDSSSSSGGDHNVCTICFDRMKTGDEVVAFGPCSHIFHLDCALNLVRKKTTCPLCRSQMPSFIAQLE